jgi:ubiquinone/menaquinone biosynthesis C-methylase UbiE
MPHDHKGKGSGLIVNTKKVISMLVRPGDIFIDIGCGPGDYLKKARAVTEHVIGIDRDKDAIEHVRKRGFETILADAAEKIPLDDASVDSVLLANVLHECFENKEDSALSEIARVLKKGGRLGVVEFKKDSLMGPPKEIRLAAEEVEERVVPYGFIVAQTEDVGLFNYMIVFERG